jgi:hypothetical protein
MLEEKETNMKSRRSQMAVAAALLLGTLIAFSVQPAVAQQSLRLKANIPFEFYAGDKLMPAGAYRVEYVGSQIVRLSNSQTYEGITFFTVGASNPGSKSDDSKLVFKVYGHEKFLSEMWWGKQGSTALPSAREHELEAASQTPVRLVLAR